MGKHSQPVAPPETSGRPFSAVVSDTPTEPEHDEDDDAPSKRARKKG